MRTGFQIVSVLCAAMLLVCTGFTMRCECADHVAPQAELLGVHCCETPPPAESHDAGFEADSHPCSDSPYQIAKANLTRMGQDKVPCPAFARALPALDRWPPSAAIRFAAESESAAISLRTALPADRFDLALC